MEERPCNYLRELTYAEIMEYVARLEKKFKIKEHSSSIQLFADGSWMIRAFTHKVLLSGKRIEELASHVIISEK
jgi:hypothetical protein